MATTVGIEEPPPGELTELQVRDAMASMGLELRSSVVLIVLGGRMYKREGKTFHLLADEPPGAP